MKRQLYSGEDQVGQDDDQGSINDDETPEQQSIRLTGTALGRSTIPKADFLKEGDGSNVII